ncbi:hydroxysqualene dehydroxylase HpnE [Derxia gummosa]|uniref:Hydroxysqualene dehydroxylase HpnE n=1 Tax=Derxia gummosa DSM 723 TaxID=1121388 RepID=A0A8B6X980_9BURK|nr:hydroxysqualene dehydroxylase HpnE [Derxia gummosa]
MSALRPALSGGGTTGAGRRVAVIGAGWAGCAAAVELAEAGWQVTVIEAAREAGGRARRITHQGEVLDNGQHILIGAYRETLALMARVGVPGTALRRLPLRLDLPGRFSLALPRLPAPFHVLVGLLAARGLTPADKLGALRWMVGCRLRGFSAPPGMTVADWIAGAPAALRELMLEPLCVAALNTRADEASAAVFARVLRDSLGAGRAGSDLLLPAADLGALLPDAALARVRALDGEVRLGARLTALRPIAGGAGWHCDSPRHADEAFDAVIVATPAATTAALLRAIGSPAFAPALAALDAFEHEPIATIYLRADSITLPAPMIALTEDPASDGFGQFAFDRRALGLPDGRLAVVASGARDLLALDRGRIAAGAARQLARALGIDAARFDLADAVVITEKRATFRCVPGVARTPRSSGMPKLFIAGDHSDPDYPATLEAAVRSGLGAARALLTTA